MFRRIALCIWFLSLAAPSHAQTLAPDQARFLGLYRMLVETDTTETTGDTQKAVRIGAKYLKAGGFARAEIELFDQAERKGDLVARLKGSGAKRPILLLAHLDVVEAKREDWSSDPFTLTEQDGYYYGRGTIDDKAMAAIFLDTLVRYRAEGFIPARDIILALTTDEETPADGDNGVAWLLANHRDRIDAEFALNEGGGGLLKAGKPYLVSVQTSEKQFANFSLSVRNPGGHSSLPSPDNAIYRLAAGLTKLAAFRFPVHLNDTTRANFQRMALLEEGQTARDMKAVTKPKPDPAAVARLSAVPRYNALLRTTCVATRLDGGHADNALPQLAHALVNCRILPGERAEDILAALKRVVADDQIAVTQEFLDAASPATSPQGAVMAHIERLTEEMWPGTPVLPAMSTGATDARFLRGAGIATYGTSGVFLEMGENRAHGKDERVPVKSLWAARDYLYRLVKMLAEDSPG